jgi:hypothetical protein
VIDVTVARTLDLPVPGQGGPHVADAGGCVGQRHRGGRGLTSELPITVSALLAGAVELAREI